MRSWHVIQEVIVKSKNEIIHVEDEIVTLRFKFFPPWIKLVAYSLDCHIVGAHTVTNHPAKLEPTKSMMCISNNK